MPGAILGALLVGAGTAGLVSVVRGDDDAGPIAEWLRLRLSRGGPAGPDGEDGGFSPGAVTVQSAAGATALAGDDPAFAFKGKVPSGSTFKSRALALFWLTVVIGVVAVVIAGALFAAGELVNAVIQNFIEK